MATRLFCFRRESFFGALPVCGMAAQVRVTLLAAVDERWTRIRDVGTLRLCAITEND
ncbi:hypothetical protein CA85_18030 [Allorhodopirellula solitaria]|uniref:Uncharacterized protein n=1 Tax=Allorhodopirellula solitaria TaxID=2527987 RepID=A0A5C5YE70_9BACT|nr:hypothetical protein CA85_18030 [Allorhodopirellula solitaria]